MKLQEVNKNILFFSNQGLSPLHLGYELEIINGLIEKGYNIISVTCNNELSTCFFNPTHNLLACAICEARTKKAHQHFEVKKEKELSALIKKAAQKDKLTLMIEELEDIRDQKGIWKGIKKLNKKLQPKFTKFVSKANRKIKYFNKILNTFAV